MKPVSPVSDTLCVMCGECVHPCLVEPPNKGHVERSSLSQRVPYWRFHYRTKLKNRHYSGPSSAKHAYLPPNHSTIISIEGEHVVVFPLIIGASPKKMMSSSAAAVSTGDDSTDSGAGAGSSDGDTSPDNLFSEFRRLCGMLEVEPSYNAKTKIVADFIKHGSTGGRHQSPFITHCMVLSFNAEDSLFC